MPALVGPAVALAALLALAGGQKLLDPAMTAGALRAMGLPGAPVLVRAGAAAELALGVTAVVAGGTVVWMLVAASYLAFAGFVLAALQHGTMIGSCGCFGREETPPHPSHVALNVALAVLAGAIAIVEPAAPLDALIDHPGSALAVGALSVVAVGLLYAAFVEMPRALVSPLK